MNLKVAYPLPLYFKTASDDNAVRLAGQLEHEDFPQVSSSVLLVNVFVSMLCYIAYEDT